MSDLTGLECQVHTVVRSLADFTEQLCWVLATLTTCADAESVSYSEGLRDHKVI